MGEQETPEDRATELKLLVLRMLGEAGFTHQAVAKARSYLKGAELKCAKVKFLGPTPKQMARARELTITLRWRLP